jgi:hypothetical protein
MCCVVAVVSKIRSRWCEKYFHLGRFTSWGHVRHVHLAPENAVWRGAQKLYQQGGAHVDDAVLVQ